MEVNKEFITRLRKDLGSIKYMVDECDLHCMTLLDVGMDFASEPLDESDIKLRLSSIFIDISGIEDQLAFALPSRPDLTEENIRDDTILEEY